MADTRFKVTFTMKAEDLTNDSENSEGSEIVMISETVGRDTRHLMEKSLTETIVGWGDLNMEQRVGGQGGKGPGK